jgi:hypothetical protein
MRRSVAALEREIRRLLSEREKAARDLREIVRALGAPGLTYGVGEHLRRQAVSRQLCTVIGRLERDSVRREQ